MHFALASMLHLLLDRRHDCEVLIDIDTARHPAIASEKGRDAVLGLRLGQTAWLLPVREVEVAPHPPAEREPEDTDRRDAGKPMGAFLRSMPMT